MPIGPQHAEDLARVPIAQLAADELTNKLTMVKQGS
jgi:hypothetical protein